MHQDKSSITDRERGCLIGLAVGDAVGASVEFCRPGTFAPLTDMIGGGPFQLAAGEWTDDTSMALCLAESIVETGRFDPVDQLQRYLRWYRHGHMSVKNYCFDIGGQTRMALEEHERTGKPHCGPANENNAGNGSLMRLAPVPIAWASFPDEAIRLAGESSKTTHGNRECVDACRYFGGLLVGAIRGESKQTLLSPMYSPTGRAWSASELAPKITAVATGSFLRKEPPAIRGTGYVVDCLEAALWAFAKTSSFDEAVLASANLGDDADTTAAVCGQIAGAFYGQSKIRPEWIQHIALRSQIDHLLDELVTCGES